MCCSPINHIAPPYTRSWTIWSGNAQLALPRAKATISIKDISFFCKHATESSSDPCALLDHPYLACASFSCSEVCSHDVLVRTTLCGRRKRPVQPGPEPPPLRMLATHRRETGPACEPRHDRDTAHAPDHRWQRLQCYDSEHRCFKPGDVHDLRAR